MEEAKGEANLVNTEDSCLLLCLSVPWTGHEMTDPPGNCQVTCLDVLDCF